MNQQDAQDMKFWHRWGDWQWCALIAFVTLAAFAPGLRCPFMLDWDDGAFVIHNQHLEWTWENLRAYFTHPFLELYTPVPMVSLMLDHALFGLNPLGYHLHGLLLHTASALLLYGILRKLSLDHPIATLGTLLWALSPQKVESVIWVAERKDVDCGLFAFASFFAFQCALDDLRPRHRYLLLIASGVLGVLSIWSKPATVALPGIFIVYAFLKTSLSSTSSTSSHAIFYPLVFLLPGIWISMHFTHTGVGHLERLWAIPFHNLFWYPLSALYPWHLNPIHVPIRTWGEIWGVVVAGMFVSGLLLALARWRKVSWTTILCAVMLIVGATVPVLGLLRYTDYTHCDRYNYCVSAVAWAIVLPLLTCLPLRKPWLLPTALTLLVAVFFVRTWCYLPFWETPDAFTAYIFQQPGVPNRKAYQQGITTALRNHNPALLAVIRERLRNEPPPEGIYSDPPEEALADLLDAHLAFANGDDTAAYETYARIDRKSIELNNNYFITSILQQIKLQDQWLLAKNRGDHNAAAYYLRQLEELSEYHASQNLEFPIGE
ncbi:MAG: hypothetical protein II943_04745 [Victivallales bacterium]|nr:hypothetical protein [Victivallales bacterium]